LIERTPVEFPIALEERMGFRVGLKMENLQATGSFKLRGAVRAVSALGEQERAAGVITASAGNHGCALAKAAAAAGIEATIVVPHGTPAVKRSKIEELGGHLLIDGENYDAAQAIARKMAEDTGKTFVSAYENDWVIEGNGGDLGRELLEQVPELSKVVVPVGGGGMIAGLARTLCPRGIEVLGVQPQQNCAMHDSIEQGRALTTYVGEPTIAEGCDGAVGERNYEIAAEHGVRCVLVSEAGIRKAVRIAHNELGTTVEASGAVALGGLFEGAVVAPMRGTMVVVLSGGNIDPELLAEILAE
jgi:threonine dehydratase